MSSHKYYRTSVCKRFLSVFHQNQFLCLAVLQGKLKVYYDFSGSMVELNYQSNKEEDLMISDGESKNVSLCLLV